MLCSCADQPRLQTLTDAGLRSRLQTQTALPTSSPQSARKLALSNFRHRPYIFYHSSYISICSSVIGFRLVDLFSEKYKICHFWLRIKFSERKVEYLGFFPWTSVLQSTKLPFPGIESHDWAECHGLLKTQRAHICI